MKRFDCSAVVFDLDGVLVDSTAYVERQWRRWASARGLRPEPFLRVCHGRRALETIRMAAPHLDAEAEVRAFVPLDEEGGSEPLGPLPGALRLLTALPPGSWAVATSGARAVATSRLRRAELPIPAVLVCAEDVTRGKPSPDAYLLAARSLGCPPEQVLVVEDAPAGIQAARTAGMAVVGLTTTHPAVQLDADARAASLVGVHLGRVNRAGDGRDRLELLVVEV
ncbi:MAG TPA: HAD-IA family hydrolase [Gemmatimonadales bacterium]|jgi:sugar-phosphatase|nr:HAD-IA family hydrolase [Gemmatimonadales bacterium]